MATLSQLSIGQRGKIIGLQSPPEIRQRLLEMGFLEGTEVEVIRFAPLGDPIDIKLRGYHLSLRKHEADDIEIEPL